MKIYYTATTRVYWLFPSEDHSSHVIFQILSKSPLKYGHSGHFCGWYGREWVENVDIFAIKNEHSGEVTETDLHFDRLDITTGLVSRAFVAEDDQDAVRIFSDEDLLNEKSIKNPEEYEDALTMWRVTE